MISPRLTVSDSRLAALWLEAMEGSKDSKNDILDLIDEICRLRELASLPPPPLPTPATCTKEVRTSIPLPL